MNKVHEGAMRGLIDALDPYCSFLSKDQYEALLEIADRTAERVRALDFIAYGTMKEFSKHSVLSEEAGSNPNDMGMIKKLVADHETIIRLIRDDITLTNKLNDMGTNNYLCDLIEKHEKMAWMLRAHLS